MSIDLSAIGRSSEAVQVEWTSDEVLLYALGVGAGQDDPLAELAFTTENSAGSALQPLPTFAVVLAQFRGGNRVPFGNYDRALALHAEQSLTLRAPIPVAGQMRVVSTLIGIADKGSGALATTETRAWLPGDEEAAPTVVTRSSAFIRGEGGFGRQEASEPRAAPAGKPDLVLPARTRPDQALLYRLSGDRNPLHSDPQLANRAGFARPILHGMCTYGITARVLLNALADGDPSRFEGIEGRFNKPVLPGDALEVRVWADEQGAASFEVRNAAGLAVLTRGRFLVTPA